LEAQDFRRLSKGTIHKEKKFELCISIGYELPPFPHLFAHHLLEKRRKNGEEQFFTPFRTKISYSSQHLVTSSGRRLAICLEFAKLLSEVRA
jgi:hypothetical protein